MLYSDWLISDLGLIFNCKVLCNGTQFISWIYVHVFLYLRTHIYSNLALNPGLILACTTRWVTPPSAIFRQSWPLTPPTSRRPSGWSRTPSRSRADTARSRAWSARCPRWCGRPTTAHTRTVRQCYSPCLIQTSLYRVVNKNSTMNFGYIFHRRSFWH